MKHLNTLLPLCKEFYKILRELTFFDVLLSRGDSSIVNLETIVQDLLSRQITPQDIKSLQQALHDYKNYFGTFALVSELYPELIENMFYNDSYDDEDLIKTIILAGWDDYANKMDLFHPDNNSYSTLAAAFANGDKLSTEGLHTHSFSDIASKYIPTLIDKELRFVVMHEVPNIAALLFYEMIELINQQCFFRRCKNCGKKFLILDGYKKDYCDSIVDGETEPCNVIGYQRAFNKKAKQDPYYVVFIRLYKRYFSRQTKSGKKAEFDEWNNYATQQKNAEKSPTFTVEDFERLLTVKANILGL